MKATVRCISLVTIFISLLLTHTLSIAANSNTWIEVKTSHFKVVSNAGEHDARRVAEQFEVIRAVFADYFGRTGAGDPLITILAAKDEATLRTLLPRFWENKNSMHPTGFFLDGGDDQYIVLRLDVSLNREAAVPYEPVYHEYVHFLMRQYRSQLPLWMVEGLAEFYGNTSMEGSQVWLGAPNSRNLMLLREKTLLPVSTLFGVDTSSPYYQEQSKTSIFYAESWALTHYLMARDWKEKTHRVTDFVALLQKGVNQSEAATRTIGDPGALDLAVRVYIKNASFTVVKQDRPRIDESDFQKRGISEAESLTVRGDFMVRDHRYREAQAMLEEALKLDPKLGTACESMSFLYLRQGNIPEASKWSSQAVALNPQGFRANYYLALTLMGERGAHDEQALSKAESSLRTALKANPEFAPAYDLLAYVLSQSGPTQKLDEAYMATVQAISLDPGNIRYRVRAADVQEKRGHTEDAIRVANLAVSLAKTPSDKAAADAALAAAKQFSRNPLMAPLVEDVRRKLHQNLSKDKNAKSDLEYDVAALNKLLDAGSLATADDAAARYYRASAQSLLDYFRKKDGLPVDTAVSEQSLSDLDRIIAIKTDIGAWGITMSEVAYMAGGIAYGLHSPRTNSYWQLCVDTVPCTVNLALGYSVGWEGVPPNPAKALELDLKAFDSGTKSRCAGAYAANNIARLIYFAGVSYSKDNDPVSWTQKSLGLSDQIDAQLNSQNVCTGAAETSMDEFLYRLARGDRRNALLTDAVRRFGDKATTAPALANYLSGSLDAIAFQNAVESSKSEDGRCYAYFYAMWYAYLIGNTSLVNKFYEPLSKFDKATCPNYLVYAKKFHPEGGMRQSISTQP